jgi:hypothetical protein
MFEIASAIVVQTSGQCVAVQPNNLQELPKVELDLLKSLPTTWDETRFIDGYPGKYVVLARRHGNQWYIAGLNAEKQVKKLSLNLPMLKGQTINYYTDGPGLYAQVQKVRYDKKGRIQVTMRPNGGFILK